MTEDILEKAKDALDHAISESSGGVYLDPSCNDLLPICRELIAEVERLRSENKIISDRAAHHDRQDAKEIELLAARIAELEAGKLMYEEIAESYQIGVDDLRAYIKRLEAAFLDSLAARLYYEHYPGVSDAYSWHDYPEDACHCMPKEKFREKAREALEIIKEGGKDER